MSGFELLSKLEYKEFKLVFTTAHRDYALQAIKNGAFDYLMKPIDIDDLKQCIEKLMSDPLTAKQVIAKSPELLEITARDGILYLKQKDIIRVEASGSYTNFYLENNIKHMASKAIKEYETALDQNLFFRCHNSHIINLQKVEKFVNHEGFFAKMNDGTLVDISRRNKDLFLEKIKGL
jgi:two-component system, LytTR family, response regulator